MVVGRRGGKLLALDTLIPTPSGWRRLAEIRVGDRVFDERGRPTHVTAIADEVPELAYRLTFSDGSTIDAGGDHQWVTWTHRDREEYARAGGVGLPDDWPRWRPRIDVPEAVMAELRQRLAAGESRRSAALNLGYDQQLLRARLRGVTGLRCGPIGPEIRTTEEIARTLRYGRHGDLNHSIPVAGALQLPQANLPLDPYLLGLWLGDEHASAGTLTADPRNGDIEWYEAAFQAAGFDTNRYACRKTFGVHGLAVRLRSLGLVGQKHVPTLYLWASADQRLALLRGLMDSDGHGESGKRVVEFCTTNRNLAEAVMFLARSLGQRPVLAEGRVTLYGKDCGPKYRVTWSPTIDVFLLPRKRKMLRPAGARATARLHRMIAACEPIPPRPMRCLQVDSPNELYLAGEALVPTHNSRIAALIAVYLACFRDYADKLAPGEMGTLAVIAADRRQARTVMRYIMGFLEAVPMLSRLMVNRTKRPSSSATAWSSRCTRRASAPCAATA